MDIYLKQLCECNAVASREDEMRALLYKHLKNSVDEILTDNIGSIVFHKKGSGPKLMLCAHMDEVGFLIQHISENGMLFVTPLGGVQPLTQYMQKVYVITSDNQKYTGILMCEKVDEKGVHNAYVDMGYFSKEQAEQANIQIGDMVCFATKAEMLQDTIVAAKALDDRAGCYVISETLLALEDETLHCDLFIAFTSSEEVGLRGAKTVSELVKPDMCIAVDIGSTKDVHSNGFKNHRQLGKGPMLLHYDKGCIPTQKITSYIKQTAKKISIPLQQDMFLGGGTDIDSVYLYKQGVPGAVLGIPLHYAHGAYSMAHIEDINYTVKLCVEIAKTFDTTVRQKLIDFLPE